MRLLNTTSLEFRDFYEDKPAYAVLSHRWLSAEDGGETTFREFQQLRELPEAQWTASLRKVKTFCSIAKSQGIQWAWADTCCINKDSESELSEAINSMWNWYAQSATCIVYLSDIHSAKGISGLRDEAMKSIWFTRAWTLQELLAPQQMTFFDRNWAPIGTRNDLSEGLTRRTGIKHEFFGNLPAIKRASAATRLSWAAGRKATRPEDVAYSLVGIMDIYVSPRYGSGKEEAFRVLQLEFTRRYRDWSILAWWIPGAPPDQHHGVFAPSPDAFARSGQFRPTKHNAVPAGGWTIQDQGLLTGTYNVGFPLPYVCWSKALKPEVGLSLDCVDDQGRVPRLRFRSVKGIDYRIQVGEVNLDGRGDYAGRNMTCGVFTWVLFMPFAWTRRMYMQI